MLTFLKRDNRVNEKKYTHICNAVSNEDFQMVYHLSNELIKDLENKASPLKKRSAEIYGMCFYHRARAYEEISPHAENLFKKLIEDYSQAYEILESNGFINPALFDILIDLANAYLIESLQKNNLLVEKAYECLERAETMLKTVGDTEFQEASLIRISYHKGKCHTWKVANNPLKNNAKALSHFELCLDYESKATEYNPRVMDLSNRIAEIHYYNYQCDYDIESSEQAIFYYLIAEKNSRYFNDEILSTIVFNLGYLYLSRHKGISYVNNQKSYKYFQEASNLFDSNSSPSKWYMSGVFMVAAYFNVIELELPSIPNKEEFGFHYNQLLVCLDFLSEKGSAADMQAALSIKLKVDSVFDLPGDEDKATKYTEAIINKLEQEERYDGLYIEAKIDRINQLSKKKLDTQVIENCHDVLSKIDKELHLIRVAEIHIILAFHYSESSKTETAILHFNKACQITFLLKEQNSTRNHASIWQVLGPHEPLIVSSLWEKFNAAECLEESITALETFRILPIIVDLENHYSIDHLPDKSVLKRALGQIGRTEHVYPEFLVSSATAELEDIKTPMEDIHALYKMLDQVKQIYPDYTEAYFLRNIDTCLKKISSWILIPVWKENKNRFILIPPERGFSGAVLSEEFLTFGTADDQVENENHNALFRSWIADFLDYSKSRNKIALNNQLTEQEKILADKALKSRSNDIVKQVSFHLWDVFGRWVTEIIGRDHSQESISLSIISQGPYMLFPFCIAQNPNNDKEQLSDFINISHAPSLYGLFTLQERLMNWDEDLILGLLSNNSPESNLSFVSIEQTLCRQSFLNKSEDSVCDSTLDPEILIPASNKSNYWHFLTHGSASPVHSSRTFLDGGNHDNGQKYHLIPQILTALDSHLSLRLIFMNACETGRYDAHNRELVLTSYLTEMLRTGALGVIGTLWTVPQIAAVLISGKFYDFHITKKMKPDEALNKAQCWLRDITTDRLIDFLQENVMSHASSKEEASNLISDLRNVRGNKTIFSDPYYWSGFILVGQ